MELNFIDLFFCSFFLSFFTLRLGDLADQVLAVHRIAFLDLQGGDLAAVGGGDDHFLGIVSNAFHSAR